LSYLIFDGFFNMGSNGIKLLQREIGVVADGELGPNTLAVLNQSAPSVVFEGLKDARVKFYNSLVVRKPELKVFLNGWLNRVKSFKYEI
jgi:lysozyme family protein